MDSVSEYGISHFTVIPGRKEASDASEMVTQLVFGMPYSVVEKNEKWVQIVSKFDAYPCWIDRKMHTPNSQEEYDSLLETSFEILTEAYSTIELDGKQIPVSLGAILPKPYIESGRIKEVKSDAAPARSVADQAMKLLGAPYLWGGKTIMGIDCSGLSQMVFRSLGTWIPRDAYQQAELGTLIDNLEDWKAGDLAFFHNDKGRITHVGIVLDGMKIIHASGSVRIDKLDTKGIYKEEEGKYTHTFNCVRRL